MYIYIYYVYITPLQECVDFAYSKLTSPKHPQANITEHNPVCTPSENRHVSPRTVSTGKIAFQPSFLRGLSFVFRGVITLWETNIAMEYGPVEDLFRIDHGHIPLLC